MKKSILVTGANRGIGLEMVRYYANQGWHVFATCRSPENAHALNKMVHQFNEQINVIPLDVTRKKHIEALSATLKNQPIDILFNNAGIYGPTDAIFGNTQPDDWLETFRVNTIAPLKIIEALIDNISRSQDKTIVTITSKMGSIEDNGSGGSYIYRSSKAALNAVLKSVAIDLAPKGIKVLLIHPGWVKTEMGGLNAEISTEQSVRGISRVIHNTTINDSGTFSEYDGTLVPW